MCETMSAEAVKSSEAEVALKFGKNTDSHTKIREEHKIGEDTGKPFDRFHTPVECVPVRGFNFPDDFAFRFDAGKPDWWTDDHTASAMSQFGAEWKRRTKGNIYRGDFTISAAIALILPFVKNTGSIDA